MSKDEAIEEVRRMREDKMRAMNMPNEIVFQVTCSLTEIDYKLSELNDLEPDSKIRYFQSKTLELRELVDKWHKEQ